MLVLFVVFRSICFMQTLLCCGLYELGLQVCVQTSCSSDSLTSVFNLFNPLSLALSLSALRLIFLLHDVCLEISTFAVFLMTVNTCGLHSNKILFAAAIRKVNLIQSSSISKWGCLICIHAGLFSI